MALLLSTWPAHRPPGQATLTQGRRMCPTCPGQAGADGSLHRPATSSALTQFLEKVLFLLEALGPPGLVSRLLGVLLWAGRGSEGAACQPRRHSPSTCTPTPSLGPGPRASSPHLPAPVGSPGHSVLEPAVSTPGRATCLASALHPQTSTHRFQLLLRLLPWNQGLLGLGGDGWG